MDRLMVLMRLTWPSTVLVGPRQVESGLHGGLIASQAGGEPGKQSVGSCGKHVLERITALLAE